METSCNADVRTETIEKKKEEGQFARLLGKSRFTKNDVETSCTGFLPTKIFTNKKKTK